MNYDVVLIGNKTISITSDQKKILDEALLDKEQNGNTSFMVGKNTIRLSSVKGIFESGTANFTPINESMNRKHEEWNRECEKMSNLPMKEKIDRELTIRILPMFRKHTLDEVTIAVLRQTMEAFFTVHPKYPRCPSIFWWSIIKEKVAKEEMRFMEFVISNDEAIEQWVKHH